MEIHLLAKNKRDPPPMRFWAQKHATSRSNVMKVSKMKRTTARGMISWHEQACNEMNAPEAARPQYLLV